MPGIIPAIAAAAASISITSLATTALQFAASYALGEIFGRDGGARRAETVQKRKLNEINAAPLYRHAYGTLRLGGTVIARAVAGDEFYLGILFTTRRSAGPFTVQVDGREVTLAGDASDFAGAGASAAAPDLVANHLRVWIGTGDQAGIPAALLSEAPQLADFGAYPGMTIGWFAMRAGDAESRVERWPNAQPVVTLTGNWSLVFDPRSGATGWSNNAALIALDLIRDPDGFDADDARIDMDSFAAGADICDEPVPLKSGGSELRYQANGSFEVDGEAHQFIQGPLAAAMAELIEVDGRWRYIPGKYSAPSLTLDESLILRDDLAIDLVADPATVSNVVRCSFVSPDRNWDRAVLPEYSAVDAGEAESVVVLDLDWVTSKSQAARIQKRTLMLSRLEKSFSAVFAPRALATHAADTILLASQILPVLDGVWRCTGWHPQFRSVSADAGLYALQIAVSAKEASAEADEWDAIEEPDFAAAPDAQRSEGLGAPSNPLAAAALVEQSGGGAIIGADVSWTPSASAAATHYELRWRRLDPLGAYSFSARIPASENTAQLWPVVNGAEYEIGVRAIDALQRASAWVSVDALMTLEAGNVPPPVGVSVTAAGAMVWRTPDDPDFAKIRIWRAGVNDPAQAVLIAEIVAPADYEIGFTDPAPAPNFWFASSLDLAGRDGAKSPVPLSN